MEEANQGLLLYHLPAELWSSILKFVDLEDLLNLSTSCRLFRNVMNKHFWQYSVTSRGLALKAFEDPRKKAVYHVTKTCHDCRSRTTASIPVHFFLRRRLCRACKITKYQTVSARTAKRKFAITEEQLGKLQGTKVANPYTRPIRLFLLSDIQALMRRKLNKLQRSRIVLERRKPQRIRIVLERRKLREEQKLAEKQAASKLSGLVARHTGAASNFENGTAAWEHFLFDAFEPETEQVAAYTDSAHTEPTHTEALHIKTAQVCPAEEPSNTHSSSMVVDSESFRTAQARTDANGNREAAAVVIQRQA